MREPGAVALFLTLNLAGVAAQSAPKAPASLIAIGATRAEVRLSWTANDPAPSGYLVERKALGGTFGILGIAPAPSFVDRTVDAFTTYSYRVRATPASGPASDPSNEITVGPPPVGLSIAAPLEPAVAQYHLSDETNFGRRLRMVLDANGDPALAYQVQAPNESDPDTVVELVTWNRARYAWNAPVVVAKTGNNGGDRAFTLARDASNDAWGVVWHTDDSTSIRLATSRDGGQTWTASTVFACGETTCGNASLALADGKIHLSFYHYANGIRYLTGNLAEEPAKWTSRVLPLPPGAAEVRPEAEVALDIAGTPAIAFWCDGSDYDSILALWREKTGSVKVTDTNGFQSDFTLVELRFNGPVARLLIDARRNDEYFTRADRNLWLVREEGGTFTTPLSLPSDGDTRLGDFSLALGAKGQATVAATETGGTGADVRCGQMKLIQSPDLSAWTACSPIGRAEESYSVVRYPQAVYGGNDKLYVGFASPYAAAGKLAGVLLWREP